MPRNRNLPPRLVACSALGVLAIAFQASRGERIDFPKEWSAPLPEQQIPNPAAEAVASSFAANIDAPMVRTLPNIISLPTAESENEAASADTRPPAFASPSEFAASRSAGMSTKQNLISPGLVVALLLAVTLHAAAIGVGRRTKLERKFQRATPVVLLGVNDRILDKGCSSPSFLRRFDADEKSSETELLAAYRLQSLHLHPDVGGSIHEFKLMQRDFERAMRYLQLRERTSIEEINS